MSSATASPPILQTDTIPSSMTLPPATPSPLKRKPSADPSSPPRESPKRPRLDSQRPSTEEALHSTKHYAVYSHNLIEEPSTARPQLLSASPVFETTQKAMREHATQAIEANVQWGATKELSTNRLYEILNSKNHVVLRYEMDIVFPAGEDADGVKLWTRASELDALPVQYELCVEYLNDNYDEEEGVERSLVVTFGSLGEAKHAMKKSAAAYIGSSSGVKVSEKRIEMVGEEGQVLRQYKIEEGRRDAQGRFIREEDLYLELSGADELPPAPEELESSAPPSPRPITAPAITAVVGQAIPEVASNSPAPATSEAEAAPGTRRQSSRIKVETQAAKDMKEEQFKIEPKPKPQPKPKAPAQPKPPAKAKTPARSKGKGKIPAQEPVDTTSHCTCRGLDDGSLMIGCDNDACPIGWYHGRCIGISKPIPKNKEWYCAMCTKEMENNKDTGVETAGAKTPAKKRGGGGGVKTKAKAKARTRK
ncbi:uncharacterized protein J4E78_006105 [Alternaria triticimaculans]|uniref:uncharacterized protein n=1 Tax=Alternaria triticimaculans TaxID=297637 RepID=UPI0020C58671|nr:uncharacterized protein J4E78_006105 [Alternaria triticimaculans]KAI4657717.1 hypothetical protein J4E78_006105 [Alternaria triticimaculans]